MQFDPGALVFYGGMIFFGFAIKGIFMIFDYFKKKKGGK